MRKDCSGSQHTVVWGHDRMSGFFLQVLDSEGEMVVWKDQTQITSGFSIGAPLLKRDDLVAAFEEYAPDHIQEFYDFEKEQLDMPLRGYIQDSKGYHNGAEYIHTYGEWLKFNDKIDTHYTLTDIADCLIAQQ